MAADGAVAVVGTPRYHFWSAFTSSTARSLDFVQPTTSFEEAFRRSIFASIRSCTAGSRADLTMGCGCILHTGHICGPNNIK